jgi:hypothetical protein
MAVFRLAEVRNARFLVKILLGKWPLSTRDDSGMINGSNVSETRCED